MATCTICGTVSRDSARFCTSCGARLEDESAHEYPEANVVEPGDAHHEGSDDENVTDEFAENSNDAEADDSGSANFASSWPESSSDHESDDSAEREDPDQPDRSPASINFATDKDEDLPEAMDRFSVDPSPSDDELDTSTDDDGSDDGDTDLMGLDNDEGASNWESWSPDLGPGAVSSSQSETNRVDAISRLIDEMQVQLQMLRSEESGIGNGPDTTQLTDRLERWSTNTPDVESLLAVVQQVRKRPRDLDAISELTESIADLELLVRHYQAITNEAGEWAEKLRRSGGD